MNKGSRSRVISKINYDENFDKIDFGHNSLKSIPDVSILIDGKRTEVNSNIKNKLYRRAKHLKETIKGGLCTKSECWKPNETNVRKMLNTEFKLQGHVEAFTKAMQVIGADPKDFDVERMRRGR